MEADPELFSTQDNRSVTGAVVQAYLPGFRLALPTLSLA